MIVAFRLILVKIELTLKIERKSSGGERTPVVLIENYVQYYRCGEVKAMATTSE